MKITNPPGPSALPPAMNDLLILQRHARGFDVVTYALTKARLLNTYLQNNTLSACVVAVSGGLDSAVVLALVDLASRQPDSPIKNVTAVLAPVYGATSNQDVATTRGQVVCQAFGVEPTVIDLTSLQLSMAQTVYEATGIPAGPWARGQLGSYLRTPAFYYITSLLTETGFPAVLIGTTNRDEGAYLGYVGKASDGMVDIQLIADLHKSEVRALAEHLCVPREVIAATPTGDMYDGRVDEAVFGAPYDFVELYLGWKCLSADRQARELNRLPPAERETFDALAVNLEKLHRYNAHKYAVGSPAVHLNLLASAVPGGWKEE